MALRENLAVSPVLICPRTIASFYQKVVDKPPLNCLVYMEKTLQQGCSWIGPPQASTLPSTIPPKQYETPDTWALESESCG